MKWVSKDIAVTVKVNTSTEVVFEAYTTLPAGTTALGSCSCIKPKVKGNKVIVRFSPNFPRHLPGKVYDTKKSILVSYKDGTQDVIIIRGQIIKK